MSSLLTISCSGHELDATTPVQRDHALHAVPDSNAEAVARSLDEYHELHAFPSQSPRSLADPTPYTQSLGGSVVSDSAATVEADPISPTSTLVH